MCSAVLLFYMAVCALMTLTFGLQRAQIFRSQFRLYGKRVVFLGTPDVAAQSLQILNDAAKAGTHDFELVAVVSQPPAPAGRNKKLTNSPVHDLAERLQLPVHTPESAKDDAFLTMLEALQPDLCITAAYGNFLPKRFLAIPKLGTLNIHPSLLPKYRGAAPVQRCLENGDCVSGVSVAETVLKMDAGPLLEQIQVTLTGNEKAPEFLSDMFVAGTRALLDVLPSYFAGTATKTPQDDSQATPANKLSVAESRIDFAQTSATKVHNRVRAFAGWPGTWTMISIGGAAAERVKIITTVVLSSSSSSSTSAAEAEAEAVSDRKVMSLIKVQEENDSKSKSEALRVVCGDGSVLGVLELQPPGKKTMAAKAFVNGLRGATLSWESPPTAEPGTNGA